MNAQKLGAEQQLANIRAELQTAITEREDARRELQTSTMQMDVSGPEQSIPAPADGPAAGPTQNGTSGLSDDERKTLEEKIAAAEAKAAELEEKANEVEARIQQTVKERCDKMRDSLNGKLKDHRTRMEEEFKRKDEDLKLRLEQEKLIWQAENQTAKPATAPEQPPATPAKPDDEAQSVPATPGAGRRHCD